jgi:hypothetical protein
VTARWHALAAASVVAAAGLVPAFAAADVAPARRLSVDPFSGDSGQHVTAVEPDSISVGNTIVAVFQVARIVTGGASGIGWATSTDGGASWSSGVLPSLTIHGTPAGPYSRTSDPSVAYDRVHETFLSNVLALTDRAQIDPATTLVVSRSRDGVSWSAPIVAAAGDGNFLHDKNWIVCDNGSASPHAGRCYVVWTDNQSGGLGITASSDGGLTWTVPVVFAGISGSGWQPLVRPDGTLVVVYETERTIEAVRSSDGGTSFSAPVTVSALRSSRVPGMRAPALPSAELDADGAITVAWQDCRYRTGCAGDAPNDVVFASSADGRIWSRTRRVPTAPELDGLHQFVPGLAVDASTRGASTRIAVAFSVLAPRGCNLQTCRVQPYFVSSSTAGRAWSAPEALAASQPLDAYPESNAGRFLGDYISTSFALGGVAVPVFAAAFAPADGGYDQGIFAMPIPPLAARPALLAAGVARVTPTRPRVGARVVVAVPLTVSVATATVSCRASASRARLALVQRGVVRGRGVCTWVVRASRPGARVAGTLTVTIPEMEVTRRFAFRTR